MEPDFVYQNNNRLKTQDAITQHLPEQGLHMRNLRGNGMTYSGFFGKIPKMPRKSVEYREDSRCTV
jgi:hypothetical protein